MPEIDLFKRTKDREVKTGVDVLVAGMEAAEEFKISGAEKTTCVINAVKFLLNDFKEGKHKDAINEKIASQLESLITADIISSIITQIVNASKCLLKLNVKIPKKLNLYNCFTK